MRIVEAREQRPWQRCCVTCGQSLEDPVQPRSRSRSLPQEVGTDINRHDGGLVCGAPMRNTGETCARRMGHRDSHRSRYVMDGEAVRRRTRQIPGWVATEAVG